MMKHRYRESVGDVHLEMETDDAQIMHHFLSTMNKPEWLNIDEEGSVTPIHGQWITWMRDHPKGLVEVQLRNGKVIRRNADTFNWHPNFRDPGQDIIAYRILDE